MDAGAGFVARSIEHHLGVRPEHVTKLGSGYGEEVFEAVLGERTVLFKSDQEAGRRRVVLEAWAYQRVRELGAPAPRVLATDLGRETYPRNFIIIEKVPGVSLADISVEPEERYRLIREAGWAIRAVHEIGIPRFGLLEEATYLRNAQVHGEFDSWVDFLTGVLDLAVPALRSGGAFDDARVDRVNRVFADHADYYDLGAVGQLLHGTFDPAHVLVDKGRITGLVGFGGRCSGDPAWDLAWFLVGNAAETRHLLDGYEPDKQRAADFEVTIPLYGGLRAILAARRADDENRPVDRDRLLAFADASFDALGHSGSPAS
ncbi:MAG: aminoglycoside phosphotransferase family protein [Acidimicrobiia bacterium]|nr:aminoglycoside phosphotransferase family protein [Acidimicrobiia bacterium]MDH3397413.1 aminoglycoside phosphotransferase family protein [Acidimicrobiia bacterium]